MTEYHLFSLQNNKTETRENTDIQLLSFLMPKVVFWSLMWWLKDQMRRFKESVEMGPIELRRDVRETFLRNKRVFHITYWTGNIHMSINYENRALVSPCRLVKITKYHWLMSNVCTQELF